MKLTVRIPDLPEGIAIDHVRFQKALRWALSDGWDPGAIWQVNNVPMLAQLEEMVYQDGQGGLAELFDGISRQLGLPQSNEQLSLLAKARAGRQPQPGQLGFSWDEEEHPREGAGGTDPKYKPGEFIPKEKGAVSETQLRELVRNWTRAKSRASSLLDSHNGGTRLLDLGTARGVLEQLKRDNAQYEEATATAPEDWQNLIKQQASHGKRVEQGLEELVGKLEHAEQQKAAEPKDLTPKQRATLQLQAYKDDILRERQRLADHQTGENPLTSEELSNIVRGYVTGADYYRKELTNAIRDPENGEWASDITGDVHRWNRFSDGTLNDLDLERSRTKRLEDLGTSEGWRDQQDRADILVERATEVRGHYNWLARQVDSETEESQIENVGHEKALELLKEAKKLKSAATREKNKTAKFFKEQENTGVGFTRHQQAFDREDAPRDSKWKWWGNNPFGAMRMGGELSAHMSQENWDAIQEKHAVPGGPDNFFFMGPTNLSAVALLREARRSAKRLTKRVPGWLLNRVADNGGEYIWSAAPPYRLGFKTQAAFDAWIEPRNETRLKSNDPRHWDDVGGFYRHADKKAYSQVGESGQRGTVDLELHEYGHMVDYLFNGGQGSNRKIGAVSETPEFKSIWKNLHPWLDNYMTKDEDASELFAEGFAVWNESEENRRRLLDKSTPEPLRRLGLFFEKFMQEGSHGTVAKSLSLWLEHGKAGGGMKEGERRASGKVTENGEDLRWDAGYTDNPEEERHEHFPTLFLKNPRKAEKED